MNSCFGQFEERRRWLALLTISQPRGRAVGAERRVTCASPAFRRWLLGVERRAGCACPCDLFLNRKPGERRGKDHFVGAGCGVVTAGQSQANGFQPLVSSRSAWRLRRSAPAVCPPAGRRERSRGVIVASEHPRTRAGRRAPCQPLGKGWENHGTLLWFCSARFSKHRPSIDFKLPSLREGRDCSHWPCNRKTKNALKSQASNLLSHSTRKNEMSSSKGNIQLLQQSPEGAEIL